VRGVCPQIASQPLIPLSPESNQGLTVEQYPTFLFYVPFGRTDKVKFAELLVLDYDQILGEPIRFLLPDKAGIVRVRLPASEPPLEVGKRYNWYFSIICRDNEPSINPFVSGWIQRVESNPALLRQLRSLPAQDQYVAYINYGIWYSALEQLAQYSTMHLQEWKNLLALYSLEKYAENPITDLYPQEERGAQGSPEQVGG
jgi:hypothetical protein